ncbi:MAG TPA: TolC family protein, partial [Candidatus Binatia bacterium]|nr:TolC family protein [Candidatus Binatia bacterium]
MISSKVFLILLMTIAIVKGDVTLGSAAEIQLQVQAAPAQGSLSPTGKLLTIEDAVRIGLDNHPRIKSASERIGSQEAVLGQQKSAYYPSINFNNRYTTSQSSTSGGA